MPAHETTCETAPSSKPISQKKLEANRRNAKKSTGPKTAEGKSASSQNALVHGLRSDNFAIFADEDAHAFTALKDAIERDLHPRGAMQHEIVKDLVEIRWKLRRVSRIEAEMMNRAQLNARECFKRFGEHSRGGEHPAAADSPMEILAYNFDHADNGFARLEVYRQRLERAQYAALRELRKLREETSEREEEDQESSEPICTTGVSPVSASPCAAGAPPASAAPCAVGAPPAFAALAKPADPEHGQDARATEDPSESAIRTNEANERLPQASAFCGSDEPNNVLLQRASASGTNEPTAIAESPTSAGFRQVQSSQGTCHEVD